MKTCTKLLACMTVLAVGNGVPLAMAAQCPPAGHDGETCVPARDGASEGLNRPPGHNDDARHGYAAGDLWQAGGHAWRAVSVAPGAARWEGVQTAYPADSFGRHAIFAGGPTRMVSGYSGPAVDIETVVRGQQVTATLVIRPDGTLDTDTLHRALSARDGGTFATVTRVYDQSGHGNHITATPGRHVVHIGAVQVAGQETLSWGENNGPGGFVLPQGVKVAGNGFFFGTTGTYASSNSGYAAFPVPVMLGGSGHEFKVFTGSYTLDGFVHVADPRSPDQRTDLVMTNSPAAFGVNAAPTGYTLESGNARVQHPGMLTNDALTGGYIGYNADGGEWFVQGRNTGQWTGIVIADHTAAPGEVANFQASAAVLGNYMPQLRNVVVAIGDSRTEGFRLSDGTNWPYLMQRFARYQSYNFAVSGATSKQMLGMVPAAESVAAGPGRRVAVVFGGYNDHLPFNHIATDDTVRNLSQIVSRLKKAGYRVAILDEATTQGAPRQAVHAAIQNGTIAADIEIDPFAPGEKLTNVLDQTTWDADTTHPAQAGHQILADMIWSRIQGLLR